MRIQAILLLITVTAAIGYGVLRADILLFGPTLTVFSPKPHEVVEQRVTLSGEVKNAVSLTVNDIPVLPDRSGLFHHTLTLSAGRSIVEVQARSRQNRKTTLHLPIVVTKQYAEETDKKENSKESRKEETDE